MATNDFLPYATGATANVTPQATWAGSPVLTNGQVSGYAKSADNNKAIRQPSFISGGLAQWAFQELVNVDIRDDGNLAEWVANLDAALTKKIQGMIRIKATGALTVYVSTTRGNDNNDGLSTNTSFKTIQQGVDYMLSNVDLGPYPATVMIEGGTYNEQILAASTPMGAVSWSQFQLQTYNGQVAINGQGGTIILEGGALMTLNGNFLLSCIAVTNYPNGCIVCAAGARCGILGTGLVFGNSPGAYHMAVESGGEVHNGSGHGQYSIAGGAALHYNAGGGGLISMLGLPGFNTITLQNSPAFTTFANSFECSTINVNNMVFTGTGASGQRYQVTANAVINTLGAGASYLPGSTAGATSTGGQYV